MRRLYGIKERADIVIIIRQGLLIFVGLTLFACSAPYPYGEFGKGGDMDAHNLFNAPPVILIHGIKGSKLVYRNDPDKGDVVWGTTGANDFLNTYKELAIYPPNSLTDVAWDDEHYLAAVDPMQRIKAERLLETFPIGWKFFSFAHYNLYGHLVQLLTEEPVQLERDQRIFLYTFDWRLDNRVSAILLANKLTGYEEQYLDYQARLNLGILNQDPEATDLSAEDQERVAKCVAQMRHAPERGRLTGCARRGIRLRKSGALDEQGHVRFTVVTHSMGGLVARYFTQGLGLKDHVHKLILLGSANQGGLDAIKAIIEGECPPSIFNMILPDVLCEGPTRKIHLSFGSLFQLFPRYPRALIEKRNEGTRSLNDVTNAYGLGRDPITEETVKKWKDLLSPLENDLDKFGKGTALDRYLSYQLDSARCFHLAIADSSARLDEPLKQCDERKRIRQIIAYIRRYVPVENSLDVFSEKCQQVTDEGCREPPVINFGGQCHQTLTQMLVEKGQAEFLDYRPTLSPSDSSGFSGLIESMKARWNRVSLVGDDRVPVKSFDYPHKEKAGDITFLLCQDHVGLIKDQSLHYNLLRAVFKPTQ